MNTNLVQFVTMMGLIGIPSIFAMLVWCFNVLAKFIKMVKILMEAQQKQMARDLSMDYKMYMKEGYIEDEDLELWEENYQKYHALGANGIMDNKRAKLMALPNVPPAPSDGGN